MEKIKYVKNLRYVKNARNAKNVWNVRNVLHIFYHFCIKRFCKILQVLTGLNLQDLAKTFHGKNKICKEFKVCEECEECEECMECEECVTHFLPFLCKTFLQVLTGLDVQNLAKTFGGKKYVKNLRYVKNVRNAKNMWNVLHIFYHFCIKCFCKILQVLTGLNLQNLAKTFDRKKNIYVKNLRYMKNVRNTKNVWNVRNVLHIFYHFCIKRFCKILQVLTGLNLQDLAKTFGGKKNVKNLRYMKNVSNAKNVWNVRHVLHIFYHFCIKRFCKILQVLTGLDVQNLAKTFGGKKICKEFKVCEECEECEEWVEFVTHFLLFLYKMFLQDFASFNRFKLAKSCKNV